MGIPGTKRKLLDPSVAKLCLAVHHLNEAIQVVARSAPMQGIDVSKLLGAADSITAELLATAPADAGEEAA